MTKRRIILHIDMNSFFASVEIALNPSLQGKPVAITGNINLNKGIIVTCSYEARTFGVRTTMPLWEARKLCPSLIVVKANHNLYREFSKEIMALFFEYTPLVEVASIDEAYLDITEQSNKIHPIELAKTIQKRLYEEMKLPCSIGIAPNKFLAKTASDMKKPMGITVLRKRDVQATLWHLPVENLHGVGVATAKKLHEFGIQTVKQLAEANDYDIKLLLGVRGIHLKEHANGEDRRPVDVERYHEIKTVGNSSTFPQATKSIDEIHMKLQNLSHKVATRLKMKQVVSLRLSVIIRYQNGETITRSKSYSEPISTYEDIYKECKTIFHENWNKEDIRLLGVTSLDNVNEKEASAQLDLFSFEKFEKENKLNITVQKLQKKFGNTSIQTGKEYWKKKEKE